MTESPDFSSSDTPLTFPQQESVLWEGHPSWWCYAPILFLSGILIYVFGAGLLLVIAVFLHRKTHYFRVTNKKIAAQTGLFKRKQTEISFSDILTIEIDTPSLPIVAGIADIIFRSKQGNAVIFRSVYPAQEIRKLVLEKMVLSPEKTQI